MGYHERMHGPYRETFVERTPHLRALDPWMLALLFAWVCDLGRIGLGLIDHRSIVGELGFAGVLAVTTVVAGAIAYRKRSSRERSS